MASPSISRFQTELLSASRQQQNTAAGAYKENRVATALMNNNDAETNGVVTTRPASDVHSADDASSERPLDSDYEAGFATAFLFSLSLITTVGE